MQNVQGIMTLALSDLMNIKSQREEILRLIAKMGPESSPAYGIPKLREEKGPMAHRLALRRRDLVEIKKKRTQLETGLLDTHALGLYQTLVKRIEAIEDLLHRSLGEKSAALEAAKPSVLLKAPQEAPRSRAMEEDWTLGGTIQEGLLADILQLVSSNMMSGVLSVCDGKTEINLYYAEGEIFHAAGEGMTGESAFYAAMAHEKGRFFFKETKELPSEKSIANNTQFLILEALRQVDEANAKHTADQEPAADRKGGRSQ